MRHIVSLTGVLLVLLTGCATVPPAIRYAPPGDLQLPEARANPDVHTGRPVRWGGTIVSVQNKEAETILEVLQRELDGYGEPSTYVLPGNRFLMRVEGFLDPAVYVYGREVTVAGTLAETTVKSIGEAAYTYPVVKASQVYLWRSYPRYGYYPYYPRFHFGFGFGHGHRHGHGLHFGSHHFFHH